jgi:hypothetical protein
VSPPLRAAEAMAAGAVFTVVRTGLASGAMATGGSKRSTWAPMGAGGEVSATMTRGGPVAAISVPESGRSRGFAAGAPHSTRTPTPPERGDERVGLKYYASNVNLLSNSLRISLAPGGGEP